MSSNEYQAGVCNIGGRERTRRRRFGYASLLAGAGYVAVVLAAGFPETYLFGVFIFLYGGVLGVLQARRRFCVAYGMAGRYGFDDGEGNVEDADARARDRKRALLLSAEAIAAAVFGASVIYGLAVSL